MVREFTGKFDFLSNNYVSPITLEEDVYPTVTHGLILLRYANDINAGFKQQLLEAPVGSDAIKLFRKEFGNYRYGEAYEDYAILRKLLDAKFAEGTELATKLLATLPHILVNTNTWHDNMLGVCVCSDCTKASGKELGVRARPSSRNWQADITFRNNLGVQLMSIRSRLNTEVKRGAIAKAS
jgi:predicted NAD-dependent protein-ADP-ribosyltransferase YbiA (DUF1768 family)